MAADIVRLVPSWMIVGVGLGVVATVIVLATFYLGDRFLPTATPAAAGRVDGPSRRRSEIRSYLQAIDERFLEDHRIGDATVAFYLPARDVAITFDAHLYFHLEDTDTFTVLCEHEMPGGGLGRRLPFDVPEADGYDGVAVDDEDPITAAFEELGLPRSADEDAIRRAYRERVKDVHPDQGGTEDAFRRVREAYTTARNHCHSEAHPETVRDRHRTVRDRHAS